MFGSKPSTLSITGERPAYAPASSSPVVGLRVAGARDVFVVPAGRGFSLGTDEGHDVRLPDMTVSRSHCVFEWVGHDLWVNDVASKNGTYVNGIRVGRARIVDGSVIVVGKTTLIAFSEDSRDRRGRDELLDGRDPKFRIAVDAAFDGAMRGEAVVIVGEPGSGRERLAHAIHEVAIGPALPFVHLRFGRHDEATPLDAIAGTLFVDEVENLPTSVYRRVVDLMSGGATLHDASGRARFRVVASSKRRLWPGSTPSGIVQVTLPPLRERPGDILLLADRFAEELLGPARAPFPASIVEALRRYTWPKNLDELREAVRRLAVIATHTSVGDAAAAVGLSKSGLTDWLYARGIPTGK